MKARIHFTMAEHTFEDSIVIEAPTLEEIQRKAHEEVKRRGLTVDDYWADEIEEDFV